MKEKLNQDVIKLWMKPATQQRNDELYEIVTTSCGPRAWLAADEMIRSNIGLGISIVNNYLAFLSEYGHMRDDLISAAILGIAEGVTQMIEKGPIDDPKPTQMMARCIHSKVGRALEGSDTVRIPVRTKKRHSLAPVQVTHFTGEDLSTNPDALRDLRETIDDCCENTTERTLIAMREQGYTDREIAEQLDLPHTTIYVMRRSIYKRFLESTGWKGQV